MTRTLTIANKYTTISYMPFDMVQLLYSSQQVTDGNGFVFPDQVSQFQLSSWNPSPTQNQMCIWTGQVWLVNPEYCGSKGGTSC